MKIRTAQKATTCAICEWPIAKGELVSHWFGGQAHEQCAMDEVTPRHIVGGSTQIRRTRIGTPSGSPGSRAM